ncbi:MAG TPA: hypothetical protein DCR40_05290 [Prolixibacteraceae bacterium]|nr:hypothetical protein [Prolixibacteraceae bacterium]
MKEIKRIFVWVILTLPVLPVWSQQVQIVNMIPNAQSNETAQDREPNLAINPATPNQLVGTAFTPNPLGATVPPSAPIFFSLDGGQTWVLNSIVPSGSLTSGTGDITAKFGTTTNWLYSGILRSPANAGAARTMDILRTDSITGIGLMQLLSTRDQPDQPYVYAATPDDGVDRMYVGNNDLGVAPPSAMVDMSLNGSAAVPVLTSIVVERRTPSGQDGPPVRLAIHPDGTIYGIYVQRTASAGIIRTANIVVIRDDNWASGANPFSALTDPGDGIAGRIVISGIQFTFSGNNTALGQERIGDKVTIAVDPNNNRNVYIAWVDNTPTGGAANNIHIRRSTDAGANWSANDLYQVNNAINPDIAINSLGEVAFSYQQLTGGNWLSMIERTTNDFVTRATNTLNTFPDNTPAGGTFFPYLGDYAYMTAMPTGKDFCGVFSASNDPTPARFPTVQPTWQRNINVATNQLRNLTNTANVAVSIDPYFYRVSPIATNDDFYVRDWTTTAASKDLGEEPSTNPVFYHTSDIWNRRSNTTGTFNANDQPENQDPRPIAAGHNFVFARVHRKAMGNAATVNMLFLKSEFGTGSNYQLINGVSSFSSLAFAAADVQQTMTSGVQWDLIDPAAVTANHVCIAVEIAGPNDPSGNPTLLGRAPGWSNGTDLLVISDNNKAQRNLQVYTGVDGNSDGMTMYAVAHNAALFERDMHILLNPYGRKNSRDKFNVTVVGGKESGRNSVHGDTLILSGMKPCENRWIELSVYTLPALNAGPVSYLFEERVNKMKINGFDINVKSGKLAEVGEENLGEHAFAFQRLLKEFGVSDAETQARISLQLLQGGLNESAYTSFLTKNGAESVKIINDFINKQGSDPFAVVAAGNNLSDKIRIKNWNQAAMAHGNFVRRVNACLSYLDKSGGDRADIIQTIRWFKDIVRRSDTFKHSKIAEKSIEQAGNFITRFSERKLSSKDYPSFIEKNQPMWEELVKKHIPNHNFDKFFSAMKQNLKDPKRLQKSHCEFTMELSRNVKF